MVSLEYLTKTRRALHQMPELSLAEFKTSDYIAAELKKMGHKFKKINTGIVCDISGCSSVTKIALRCDIDALPIQEQNKCEYKSQNQNMHACGHDGHTAMLLETARILSTNRPKTDVRLIFQFGEEGYGGAEKMIEGGCLNGVSSIFAFHLSPDYNIGEVATNDGALFAGCVEFDVNFIGKAAHCAAPENGTNAISSLSYFLNNSDKFNQGYKGNTLFHIGKILAGGARNIVAETAQADCTLRYFDDFQQEQIMMKIAACLTQSDNLFKTQHNVTVHEVYPPLINSPIAVAILKKVCPQLKTCEPKYTAEDFAFYLKKIGGCMAWLGVRDSLNFSPLHSSTFDFNEKALITGVEIFSKLVL